MVEGKIHVHCKAPSGETGDYVAVNGVPVSPLFDSLAGLFPWMAENGWKMEEYVDGAYFMPWRAVKAE